MMRIPQTLLPPVVLIMITAAILVSVRYAYRTPTVGDRTYLPSDGAYAQVQLDRRPGQLEQSVSSGLGVLSLGAAGEQALQHSTFRDWAAGHDLWLADARTDQESLRVILEMDADGPALLGLQSPTESVSFQPALPVAAGTQRGENSERASGQVQDGDRQGDYAADIHTTGDGACLNWRAAVTGTAQPIKLQLRTCAGSGLRQFRMTRTDGDTITLQVDGDDLPDSRFDGELSLPEIDSEASQDWQLRQLPTQFVDGSGVASVPTPSRSDPVPLSDRRYAVAGYDEQLTVFRVGQQASERQWVGHPGGRIVDLVGAGDLLIVATDQRQLIGYDRHGFRVWQQDLPDLVAEAVVSGDHLLLSVFGGSVINFELRTGRQVWLHSADSVLASGGLDASDQVVAFADADSTSYALDADTGEVLSSATGALIHGTYVDGDAVLLLRGDRLYRQPIGGGRPTTYAKSSRLGADTTMSATGGIAVLSGERGVLILDLENGDDLASQPAADKVSAGPSAVLIARSDGKSSLVSRDRPTGRDWPTSPPESTAKVGLGSWGAILISGSTVQVIA